jgi:hypothetical protein
MDPARSMESGGLGELRISDNFGLRNSVELGISIRNPHSEIRNPSVVEQLLFASYLHKTCKQLGFCHGDSPTQTNEPVVATTLVICFRTRSLRH